jgi:hypothetical protein
VEEARQHSIVDSRGYQLALIYSLRAMLPLALLVIVAGFSGLMLPQHAAVIWCAAGVTSFSLALYATWRRQEFWAMSRTRNPGCFWTFIVYFAALVLVCAGLIYFLLANW